MLASDMASLFPDGDLNILPILGDAGAGNLARLDALKVDLAFVSTDALAEAAAKDASLHERLHAEAEAILRDPQRFQCPPSVSPKAALPVGDLTPRSEVVQEGDHVDTEFAVAGHVIRLAKKARADHEVGLTPQHRRQNIWDLIRIVLTVAVEGHQDVGVQTPRGLETTPCGCARAQICRVADHLRSCGFSRLRRAVCRSVVYDDDMIGVNQGFSYNIGDEISLVVTGDGDDHTALIRL